jgi:hypothetical protein
MSAMSRLLAGLFVGAIAVGQPFVATAQLVDARRLYNQTQYEDAIKAAVAAQADPATADEASLIIARANLERYRQSYDATHLTSARESLKAVHTARLTPRSQAEYLVGLGEWLFLDDRYGAAAELFDTALGHSHDVGPGGRDRVLDWWATAMDRYAQVTPLRRTEIYQRIVDRMQEELRERPESNAGGYWLPAAARSMGDLDRAWQSAIAAWLRVRIAEDQGATLRPDLDRLVETAIIPERAREIAGPEHDPKDAADVMLEEWAQLKTAWN